jgi:undecaprenyl-diphosphatase
MDDSVLHTLNTFFAHHDAIEDPIVAYVNAAEILFLAGLILAFVLIGGHHRRAAQRAVVAAGLSAGIALALAKIIATVVDRPRPFVSETGIHLFGHHAADPGFPSDHATAAFAIGVALLLRNRLVGTVVLILAAILSVGRVAMGVHYPSDVLAGAALGSAVALALATGPARRLLNRIADLVGGTLDSAARSVVQAVRG